MDDTRLELQLDVQRNSCDLQQDDAPNDAHGGDSATMADDFPALGLAPDARLARLVTAWERLGDADRQRLVNDAERLAENSRVGDDRLDAERPHAIAHVRNLGSFRVKRADQ